MPPPQAKATKKLRGIAAIRDENDPESIFLWLSARFARGKMSDAERTKLALELLPYMLPKKKSVEHTGKVDTSVRIIIGGTDD